MNLYDILKAFGQIIFPSILTFIGVLGNELGWTNTETILKIGAGFITMWNSIIIIWNRNYYKKQVEELTETANEGDGISK